MKHGNLYASKRCFVFCGGGVPQAVLDRITALENRITELEGREATQETLGLVRLSDSSAVTDSTGLALPTSEKNASVDGTLANNILKNSNKIKEFEIIAIDIPANNYIVLEEIGTRFAQIVFLQGSYANSSAAYLLMGYGSGTSVRYRYVQILGNDTFYTVSIDERKFMIKNGTNATISSHTVLIYGKPLSIHTM